MFILFSGAEVGLVAEHAELAGTLVHSMFFSFFLSFPFLFPPCSFPFQISWCDLQNNAVEVLTCMARFSAVHVSFCHTEE